jgi:hypothetical protein
MDYTVFSGADTGGCCIELIFYGLVPKSEYNPVTAWYLEDRASSHSWPSVEADSDCDPLFLTFGNDGTMYNGCDVPGASCSGDSGDTWTCCTGRCGSNCPEGVGAVGQPCKGRYYIEITE